MQTVVVGGGVIGVALAYELQKRGRSVVLVERAGVGKGASFGNMASIAVTEFMPASRPSVWRQMPGWMLDPQGPVRIRPSYIPKLVPWMWRFLKASRPSVLRALEEQGAALCGRVHEDLGVLLRETGMQAEMTEEGCLSLYATKAELAADRDHIEILERFGFAHRHISGGELRELEPEIDARIGQAVLFPENRSLKDPYRFVTRLAERFQELGGQIVSGEVTSVQRGEEVQGVRLKDGRSLTAKTVVLACGAYTGKLAAQCDEPIPLETERGYHTQIMDPGLSLKHSIIWPAKAFMVTPTAGGIRVGGTVEMAGLDAAPDYRRAKITVARAREALPNLRVAQTSEWMGHRPAMPDTVPVISASAKTRGLYYATGHGHLGLTYAATNARLLSDLICGAKPPLDLRPYRVDRF